jgi:hypothetical protein
MEERITNLNPLAVKRPDGEPFVDYGRGNQKLCLIYSPTGEFIDFRPFSRLSKEVQ